MQTKTTVKFEIGDLVKLKSGGPKMTVTGVAPGLTYNAQTGRSENVPGSMLTCQYLTDPNADGSYTGKSLLSSAQVLEVQPFLQTFNFPSEALVSVDEDAEE